MIPGTDASLILLSLIHIYLCRRQQIWNRRFFLRWLWNMCWCLSYSCLLYTSLLNQKSRHQWVTRFFEFHFHCTKRNFPYLICADYDQSPQCHRYKRINMLVWLMNRRCWAFACFAHNIALYKHLLNMQISVHIFNNSIPDRRIFHAKLPYGCSGDLEMCIRDRPRMATDHKDPGAHLLPSDTWIYRMWSW